MAGDRRGARRARHRRRSCPVTATSATGPSSVRSMVELRTIAELATLVHEGTIGLDDAVLRTAYPADAAREPLERALAQLRGELD